jgi:hypothetical protein
MGINVWCHFQIEKEREGETDKVILDFEME